MLDGLCSKHDSRLVYRLVGSTQLAPVARRKGLNDRELIEASRFLGNDVLDRLLSAPFMPKTLVSPLTYYSAGRFSDGSWPVFYSGADQRTAESELGYYRAKEFAARTTTGEVYQLCFRCQFDGTTIDLTSEVDRWPDLISSETENAFCRGLGRIGRTSVDAFLAPSARLRPEGVTVPVFQRRALANAEAIGITVYKWRPSDQTMQVEYV